MNDAIPGPDTSNAISLRQRIVDQARLLFHEHGYSKVSASEIASALGISKKTLYKEFETKEDILKAVIMPKLEASAKELDDILNDAGLTYFERLRRVMMQIGLQYQRVSHVLIRDVRAHAPNVWQAIMEYRERRFEKFAELIKRGAREGVFRSDVDPAVVLALYQTAVDSLMNPNMLVEFPCTPRETFQMILTILFEGIVREDLRQELKLNEKEALAR